MSGKQTQQITQGNYRPEIDGLRAFAVIAVIINHFNKDILPGGYLGVDIFFVISGYVITSSLYSRPSKNFKDFISGFYERRIKRLVPALSVFILITSIAICVLNPNPGISLITGITSLFGFSNLHLLRQSTDYFDQTTELNVFTHTWSLGVEEQFYILFPFLIWFSGFGQQTKSGARNLFLVVGALTITSLIGFLYLYPTNQPAAYFLMPSRFWEMAGGCLIFIGFQKRASIEQFLEKVPPLLVVALILAVMYLPMSMASTSTIAVVALSSILIACLKKQTAAFQVFTNPNVVYIGMISYSLYLWHWGVLSISRWSIGIHWWSVPFQVALMLGLACASYRWVETPLRKGNWFGKRWVNLVFGGAVLLITSCSLVFFGKSRLITSASRYLGITEIDGKTIVLDQDIAGTSISRQNCHNDSIGNYQDFNEIIRLCSHSFARVPPNENFSIFLGGDSHSYMLRPAISRISNEASARLYSISGGRFPPNRNRYENGKVSDNPRLMNDYMKFISSTSKKGDVVIVSNRLSWMFSPGYSINRDDLLNFNLEYKNLTGKRLTNDEALKIWSDELFDYSKALTQRGVKFIYVLPFPEFTMTAPNCLANIFRPKECAEVSKGFLRRRYSKIYSTLRSIETRLPGFFLVDPFDALCPEEKCNMVANDGESVLYIDSNHISNYGSSLMVPLLKSLIK
jgi:peptidoglycan/LPS O-acetylase OafA/YrhL